MSLDWKKNNKSIKQMKGANWMTVSQLVFSLIDAASQIFGCVIAYKTYTKSAKHAAKHDRKKK